MQNEDNQIAYFAETDSRNKRVPFGIKAKDRTRHMYIIGKTGMGKSTLLENMAVQDIKNGNGLAFIDPHGKTAELLLDYIPENRIKDVLYFAPFDLDYPISFNVMEDVGADKRHLVVNGLMSAFKKIWVDAWSARMEYILGNTLLALLESPDSTILSINRMLSDKDYRKKVVDNVKDPAVKSFWVDEFAKYTDRFAAEATPAIQNKIGQFISNPLIRNIVGQAHSSFDVRDLMDNRKIFIVNLSKGRVGEANANLLGSMLITKIYLGAMSRADQSPSALNKLPNFYLYVDEFQSFANESFADILSEARKYKLNLTIAHQYIEQMPEEVRAAVFGNVGTMITFRVGAFDAEVLEKEFAPYFTAQDLVNLGFVQIYLKLMIDGISSQPFSAVTLPPIEKPIVDFKNQILEYSRSTYAKPRAEVEQQIISWHQPQKPPVTPAPIKQAPVSSPSARKEEVRTEKRDVPTVEKYSPIITKPAILEVKKVSSQTYSAPPSKPKIADIERAISSGDITPVQSPIKKDEKGPKKENIDALRSALSSVLKTTTPSVSVKTVQQTQVHPAAASVHASKPKAEEKPASKDVSKSKIQEIPEEVLNQVLHVDRPKS